MIIWYAGIVAGACLLVRLGLTGVWRFYPWFTLWILTGVITGVFCATRDPSTTAYGRIWISTEAALLVALALAVIEVWRVRMRDAHDPSALRWRVFGGFACIAAALALVGHGATTASFEWHPALRYMLGAKLVFVNAAAIALALSLLFFAWLPVPRGPHPRIMLVWLIALALNCWTLATAGDPWIRAINTGTSAVWLAVLLTWLLLLRAPERIEPGGDPDATRARGRTLLEMLHRVR